MIKVVLRLRCKYQKLIKHEQSKNSGKLNTKNTRLLMFDLSKKVLHKKESKAMLMKWNRKLC